MSPTPRRRLIVGPIAHSNIPPLRVNDGVGPTWRDLVAKLTNDAGAPLVILPWWERAFAALEDPAVHELLIWLPRQAGKSQFCAVALLLYLVLHPGTYSVLISAGEVQAQAIFARKIRGPFQKLARALGINLRGIVLTKRGIAMPETDSAIEVLASDAGTLTGRSVNGVALVEETRDVDDAIITAMLPSVIGGGGKLILASTAGAPRGLFYEACSRPTAGSCLIHSTANANPFASRPMLDFLTKRLAVLAPTAARRELGNEFVDDADSLFTPELIEANVDDTLGELPAHTGHAGALLDLSRSKDKSTLAVVVREAARRPGAADHAVLASLTVWDPTTSPGGVVDYEQIKAALAALPRRFPGLETILVDQSGESAAIMGWATTHPALSLRVQPFVATPAANMAIWSALAGRLHAGTISLPRSERLLMELKSLRRESFAFGARWRVVDSSKKYHRDLSLALAGAVYALGDLGLPAADVGFDPAAPMMRPGPDSDPIEPRRRLFPNLDLAAPPPDRGQPLTDEETEAIRPTKFWPAAGRHGRFFHP